MIEDYTEYLKMYIKLEGIKLAAQIIKDLTVNITHQKKPRNPFKNVSDRTDENIQNSEQN